MAEENVINIGAARAKTDTEEAAELRERIVRILGDLMTEMRAAERKSFHVEFSIQRDAIGMPFFIGPTISKRF